jgi:hypothetical protein
MSAEGGGSFSERAARTRNATFIAARLSGIRERQYAPKRNVVQPQGIPRRIALYWPPFRRSLEELGTEYP